MARKTLLVLASTFPRWVGDTIPSFVFDLSVRLANRYNVIVVAPHAQGALHVENMMGIRVIRYRYCIDSAEVLAYKSGIIGNIKKNWLITFLIIPFLIAQLITVIRVINKEKIDLIQAHWSIPQGIMAIVALIMTRKKIPLVCTLHGSDLNFNTNFFKVLHQWIFKKSSYISTVSQFLKSEAIKIGIDSSKLTVIPMGVDAQNIFTRPPNDTSRQHLLFVGRLIKNKGVDVLLKAMPMILEHFPEQKLIIVGEGAERKNLETLSHELNISRQVSFIGAKAHDQLPFFYREASIFVSPTFSEGFGLTLVEALACGCPVIVSDVPGVRDIIEHQQTGLLFPAGDNRALATNVIALLCDEKYRLSLAKNGYEKVRVTFDWSTISDRYAQLFESVINIH